MLDQKADSISQWADTVASGPILCAICGFYSDIAPAVASYYVFMNRLWRSPLNSSANIKKLRPFKSKPQRKFIAGQKQPPKHAGVVAKLVKLAMEDSLPKNHPERVSQLLLTRAVVDDSMKLGILGNPQSFAVAADGIPFYSDCKCPMHYSDPDANWDSYRKQWYYDNNLFYIIAADSPYDLPVYLRIGQASLMIVFYAFSLCLR